MSFSSWWCTYRSSFGESAPNESAASAPLVAASSSAAATSSGVGGAPLAFAFAAVAETSPHADPPALDGAMALDRYAAAAPATCGHAMLVPLIVLVASSSPIQADFTSEPGAKMSTHAPKLEKPLLASSRAVAPTVIAVGAFAGEYPHASSLALPAATTTVMLRPCMYAAASTSDGEAPPPSDIDATPGTPGCAAAWKSAAQRIPAATSERYPEPWQFSTRTPCRVARGATPYVLPRTVPAQCVPCPLQSSGSASSSTKSNPAPTRPANCVWLAAIPVSITYTCTPAPSFPARGA